MAIKCFKQTNGYNTYINSEHIHCVRKCTNDIRAIDTKDGNTTYTPQSIESIVRWWKKQQPNDEEPKLNKIQKVYEVTLNNVNKARPYVAKVLKEILNFHLNEVRNLYEDNTLYVLVTGDRKRL